MSRVSKVPGVFCLNSKCEHYFEDNCTLFLNANTLNITEDGKCKDFKSGENIGYKTLNNAEGGEGNE